MNKSITISTSVILIGILVLGMFLSYKKEGNSILDLGSNRNAGYTSTTTSTFSIPTVNSQKALKTTAGTLGSVIITNETAGTFTLKDATSTTDVASTTIAVIPASMAEGAYAFDVAFSRGLFLVFTSTNVASSTITWD